MKDTDHVRKIMNIWMTIDELEVSKTRKYFIGRSVTKDKNQFTYRKSFGINFRYKHQVDDHRNQIHVPISLEMTCTTKFCPDCKFSWYLAVSEVNTALVSGHFQNDGVMQPSLYFWISL